MERRFLVLDDVLEVVVYLLSTARNVVGPGEHASTLFLDCAVRLLSTILDQEGDKAPLILREVREGIEARRDLMALDTSAYVDSLDDLIRAIARDMLERSREAGGKPPHYGMLNGRKWAGDEPYMLQRS